MRKYVLTLCVAVGMLHGRVQGQTKLIKDSLSFTPVTVNGLIEWEKFPKFSLPSRFKIVYQGPRFEDDSTQLPLQHGFSHLATYNLKYDWKVPFQNRAALSTGIPRANNQPWGSECLSPWGNDMNIIKKKVLEFTGMCDYFKECNIETRAPVDLFVHDFEANASNDDWIKYIHTLSCITQPYKSMSEDQFRDAYKVAQLKLHGEIMQFSRNELVKYNTKLSLYGESPVMNRFYSIADFAWAQYGNDQTKLNYLLKDENLLYTEQSPVSKYLDFVTPWAYYFHRYNEGGVDGKKGFWSYLYLPYLLFMTEAQEFWTKKDIIPFVQMRIQDPQSGVPTENIDPEMAEATPIFAILGGANGIWLWDEINTPIDKNSKSGRNLKPYEYFIAGLYRLSRHSHMFEGDFSYFRPKNPRDLAANRQPVVRGIINGGRILIAAQNPDANPEDITKVDVEYEGWKDTITLKGREVYLGEAAWKCDVNAKNLCPPIASKKIKK
ncbi:MAG: hypothetical protein U0Y10_20395 [Spirosomataceae bacterium]